MKKTGALSRIILFCSTGFGILTGLIILIFVFAQIWNTSSETEVKYQRTASSDHNILFITSASEDYEIFQTQLKGLRSQFPASKMNFDVEFYGSRRYDTQENEDFFYHNLKYKIENGHKFDAVLAGDDESLMFVEKYQNDLFSGMPVFFFGVDDYEHASRVVKNPYITGSVHLIKIGPIIESAMKINPGTKRVVAIYDSTPTGKGYANQFFSFAKLYPNLEFEGIDLSFLSQEGFLTKLSQISNDSIVLFLYARSDINGQLYSIKDLVSMVKANVDGKRLFAVLNECIYEGVVGGNIVSTQESAERTARLIYDVVEGKTSIFSVPLNMKTGSNFVVNHTVMKQLGLNKRCFPADAIYRQVAAGFWDSYGKIILAFCLIIISLIFLVVRIAMSEKKVISEKEKSDYNATHDFLTDLPNRREARVQLDNIIKLKQDFSVLIIDIDDFKNINDFFSHLCGDCVLKTQADRLKKIREEESDFFAARFGGDEFLVIHRGSFLDENSMELYNLKSMLNEPIEYNGKKLFVKVSIGVVNSYQALQNIDDIMSNADIALYEAKRLGKNNCVFFTKDMKKTALRNDEVSKKLETACQKRNFDVLYQPQVDVQTGQISGYEALTRLSDLSFPPSVFIPIAEEYGYISKLGRIVTEKVIMQMHTWKEKGIELHRVSINFSSGQLGDLDYPSYLKFLLDKYDISPSLIQLEITESLFMSNSNYAKDLFKEFENIGVSIALDDFGTGYSSLSYLSYLPVDIVKIDKSMVDNYLISEDESSFIRNISRLVHGLGMKLTVEGVEEKWQLDKLRSVDADFIQGYYFSKPISGDEVENFKLPA